ncbi:MAG: tetratricopeptide repeat protein, partial [Desulfamplus sp.]|nr:tetratricopeptide repeat protein [Desulfamplus sp.]
MRTYLSYSLIFLLSLFILTKYELTAADESDPTSEISQWSEELEKSKDIDSIYKIELLLKRGEKYRLLGYYPNAQADFTAALETAKKITPPVPLLEVVAIQSLGYLHFLMQDMEKAQTLLRDALKKADQLLKTEQTSNTDKIAKTEQNSKEKQPSYPSSPALAASCANHLGNVLAGQNRRDEALKIYKKALNYIVKQSDDPTLEAT